MKLAAVLLVLLGLVSTARATGCEWGDTYSSEPVLYGPAPPDPVADECALHDLACVAEHNERVLTLALLVRDPEECTHSTRPKACRAVYAMTFDDRIELPMLPACAWVYSIDRGTASVLLPLSGRVVWVAARPGWKPRTYLGDCSGSARDEAAVR